MKRVLSIFAGTGVGAALMYLAFRNVDLSRLPGIISGMDHGVILPVFIVTMLELYFRSLRWKLLLAPAKPVSLRDAFRLEAAALALSNILPLRLGEVVRGTYGAALFGIPITTVFSTMLVERAMDATVLALLFLLAAALGGAPGGLTGGSWLWLLPVLLAAGLAVLAFSHRPGDEKKKGGFAARFPRLASGLRRVSAGGAALRSPGTAAAIIGLAVLQWLMDALNLYLIAGAFGIGRAVTAARSAALLFTGAVAVSIPGVPGYFGNFEFAISKAAESWGVSHETAFAYAAFGHVLSYVIFTGIGLIAVYSMGLSLGRVWSGFSAASSARAADFFKS